MVGFPSQQLSTNRKESLYVNENSTMNISVLNSKLLDDVCNGSSLHSAIRAKAACTEFAPELRRPNNTILRSPKCITPNLQYVWNSYGISNQVKESSIEKHQQFVEKEEF
ncbi:hypothetical protein CEXT_580741 [Caerostris extrusa]|uniref:Uncharacterized protein n=1 Tax=Caerostris extrusa TaxID=172846 RepID=A0AAV4V216_CAEEX|nr:hypothetical protein CEXT_580741 [Caerostris extrusa]